VAFVEGELATLSAFAFAINRKPVRVSKTANMSARPAGTMRRCFARAVQDGSDCVVPQLPREHADQINDTGIGRPSSLADSVLLDLHLCVIAVLPMDDKRQGLTDDIDDDFFDEQSDDLLACFDGYTRTIPGLRQGLPQGHQPGTIFGRKGWTLLGLAEAVELHLQIAQSYQFIVPTPLQLAGNQAIVGIDSVILAASPGGLLLGLLDSVLNLLALVALSLIVHPHCGKRRLYPERLQPVKDFLRGGSIDPHAAEPDAVIDRFGAERAAADIPLSIAALASVLNMQTSATASAPK
jgi:hypothetical protein